jgi:hypothetical protein
VTSTAKVKTKSRFQRLLGKAVKETPLGNGFVYFAGPIVLPFKLSGNIPMFKCGDS